MSSGVHFGDTAWQMGMPATNAEPSLAGRSRTLLIALTILAVPVTQAFDLGGKPTNFAASDVVLPFGVVFLAWQMLHGRLRLPLFTLFCLNVAVVAASLLFNFDAAATTKGSWGIAIEVVKLVSLWLLFYVLVNSIRTRSDFLGALKFWLLGAIPMALIGIGGALAYQFAGIENNYSLMFRAQGTLGDANLFACYLAISFFLALLYLKLVGKALWVLPAIAIYLTGIFFSASRGCMLAVGVTLAVLLAIGSSWKTRLAGVAVILLAAIVLVAIPNKNELLASNPFTERLATATVSIEDDAAADRKELWVASVENFTSAPVFGIGHGYSRRPSDYDPTETSQIHNTYLGLLGETGLVGFTIYMLIFCHPVVGLWREKGSGRFALMPLLVIGLCGLTLSLENFRGLWVVLAMLEAYRRTRPQLGNSAESPR
ncbi:MAG TPA: O-antigen ligase family protein [Bryobacteraceae bacterium]|nr:O-antigen ligase family protein [Bryobacteraceae bacterium]